MLESIRSFKPVQPNSVEMAEFLMPFFALPCTHFWRGYGSAMFLEFGTLSDNGVRRDGTYRNPGGEWGLCLDFTWRIEGKRLIWCGSGEQEDNCAPTFKRLVGKKVNRLSFSGRLPELDLEFENRLHLVTLTTDAGNPSWSLMKNLSTGYQALCSRNGQVVLETSVRSNA